MNHPLARACLSGLSAVILTLTSSGETVSGTVGVLRFTTRSTSAIAVASPFTNDQGELDPRETSTQLAGGSASGDLLHLWVGTHFNTYALAAEEWRIRATDTALPDTRLTVAAQSGFLLTRNSVGDGRVSVWGNVRGDESFRITVPADTWRTLGNPYPTELTLAGLVAAGATDGDQVKLWDTDSQTWDAYTLTSATWSGAESNPPVIVPGAAFLFRGASGEEKTLTFTRPF